MKHLYNLIIILFISLLWMGCKDNDEIPVTPDPDEGTEHIQFVLNIQESPGDPTQDPSTRVVVPVTDAVIETVDLIAFTRVESGNTWKFAYSAMAETEVLANGVIKCTAALKQSVYDQRFMFLINSRVYHGTYSILQGQTWDLSNVAGGSEDALLSLLEIVNPTIWFPSRTTADKKAIPMYGMTDGFYKIPLASKELNDKDHPFLLTRMLGRIDVREADGGIEDKSDEPGNVRLVEAYLYQRKSKGYLTYQQRFMGDYYNNHYITQSWVPGNNILHYRSEVYKTEDYNGINRVTGRIYTFESENANALGTDRLKVAAIVVGLSKDGGDPTYYRIDIPRFNSQTGAAIANSMGPIMRNHCYDIEINSIIGDGELTPDEGYEGRTTINATVRNWEQVDIGIDYEGSYNLWVSKTYIKYPWDHKDPIQFWASTSHTNGFKFGLGEDASVWAPAAEHVTHTSPQTGSTTPYLPFRYALYTGYPGNTNTRIIFQPYDSDEKGSRFASYAFNAGNIYKYVHLEQTGKDGGWYNSGIITDWEDLEFTGGGENGVRLELERDTAYYDGAQARSELMLNVTGLARIGLTWVITASEGSWITPKTGPVEANGESVPFKFELKSKLEDASGYGTPFKNTNYYSSSIKERKGKMELQLGPVIKKINIIQYDETGVTLEPAEGAQPNELVLGAKEYTLTIPAGVEMYKLKLNTARKGCAWEIEAEEDRGELLGGIRNARGTGSGEVVLWINKNVHRDATATIRISPSTPQNRQEFNPVYVKIKKAY